MERIWYFQNLSDSVNKSEFSLKTMELSMTKVRIKTIKTMSFCELVGLLIKVLEVSGFIFLINLEINMMERFNLFELWSKSPGHGGEENFEKGMKPFLLCSVISKD